MSALDRDIHLKKLHYRSWHRGCKETDLVFGPFADEQMRQLSAAELALYEELLEELDADLWHWVSGNIPDAPKKYTALLDKIRNHALSRGSAVL